MEANMEDNGMEDNVEDVNIEMSGDDSDEAASTSDADVFVTRRFPAGTLISLGIRRLRHRSEDQIKKEEWDALGPEARDDIYVHALLNVGGRTIRYGVQKGGSDTVVKYAKMVRDKPTTISQVKIWRAGMLAEHGRDENGYLFVELDPKASGLAVPLQPIDKYRDLMERARPIFDAMVQPVDAENPTDEELKKAVVAWDLADAMKAGK